MILVSLEELRYAVLHDDRFNGELGAHDIDHILEIAFVKIGFTATQSPLQIDIGNGYLLKVTVEKIADESIASGVNRTTSGAIGQP